MIRALAASASAGIEFSASHRTSETEATFRRILSSRIQGLRSDIRTGHLVSGLGEALCNSPSHHTGSDHTHRLDLRHFAVLLFHPLFSMS